MSQIYNWGCTSGTVYVRCIYTHARSRVTVCDSGLCCCACVTFFERWLTPLCVDSYMSQLRHLSSDSRLYQGLYHDCICLYYILVLAWTFIWLILYRNWQWKPRTSLEAYSIVDFLFRFFFFFVCVCGGGDGGIAMGSSDSWSQKSGTDGLEDTSLILSEDLRW